MRRLYPVLFPKHKYYEAHRAQVIALLRRDRNGHLPNGRQIQALNRKHPNLVPSMRAIERRGGGIEAFYRGLGIEYTNATKGARRAETVRRTVKRSLVDEEAFALKVIQRYGARNVHLQAPYSLGSLLRSDMQVWVDEEDYFYLDMFTVSDVHSFAGCVRQKIKKLVPMKISAVIYLVACGNVTVEQVDHYIQRRKTPMPDYIRVIHESQAVEWFTPLTHKQ